MGGARSVRLRGRGAVRLTQSDPRALARSLADRTAIVPRLALALDPAFPGLDHADYEPGSTAADSGAGGELELGRLAGVPVALVRGDAAPTVPLRAARLLGADVLVLTRVVRALAPSGGGASVGLVADHVGFLVPNPLIGRNPDEVGPRFPDMSEAYDPALRALAQAAALPTGAPLTEGIYAGHPDPARAPPADFETLRWLGADWVGRGGVGEVVVARHAGMRVLGLVALEGGQGRLAALLRDVVVRIGTGA